MIKSSIALIIEGTYPWYRGGVSEWVHQYIKSFPGYDFHLIQVATDEYLSADVDRALYDVPEQVISFVRVPPPGSVISREEEAMEWFRKVYPAAEESCRLSSLIHVANTGFAGFLGLNLAQMMAKPLVLTEHALYWKEVEMGAVALECGYKVPDAESEKELMTDLFRFIAEKVYKNADEIISVSECNISHQKQMGAPSVHYIPNGVEERWLQPQKKRNKMPVVGWIGRCAEMKNPRKFFDVIDAFEKNGIPETRFMMMICDAGEPELQAEVVERAATYKQLTLICNKDAEAFLPQMDALCITSHNESQPLVLLEALGKKVFPIGWEAGDVTGDFGLIMPPQTPARTLVETFAALWEQPDCWKQEVNRRYREVVKKHTWEIIFGEYRKLFSPYFTKALVNE